MYKVYIDDALIYASNLASLIIVNPKVSLELNKVNSFEFTIYPDHPYYDQIKKLKPIVRVYQDDVLIFRGRILNDITGFFKEKKVTCESDLAFLLDSVQRPYTFNGTPSELFTQFLTAHNEQVDENHRFKVGTITVTDPNDYIARSSTKYENTWESIEDKLIDKLGGYLNVRYEEDGVYLDYLEKFDTLSSQTIEFAKNLIELEQSVKADDIFTVILPIGAEIKNSDGSSSRLLISSVNNGLDYLEHSEGIEKYGRIVKMVEWKDVTIASNLKTKAQKYLDESVLMLNQIELTSADLSSIDTSVNSFHLGTYVRLISKPHDLDDDFLVQKLQFDLSDPSADRIKFNASYKTMTEHQKDVYTRIENDVQSRVEDVKSDIIPVLTKEFQTKIETSADSILSTVSENYYDKNNTEQLIKSRTSTLEHTVDGWEQKFTTFEQDYNSIVEGTDAKFEAIEKYIRYVDGKIILGEVGNALELRIENDRLSFYQNNSEVAYFSNNKLFVTDGEYTNSLQLGKFAFLPRSTGNLSFKKVRD